MYIFYSGMTDWDRFVNVQALAISFLVGWLAAGFMLACFIDWLIDCLLDRLIAVLIGWFIVAIFKGIRFHFKFFEMCLITDML